MNNNLAIVILAAGQGKRLKSDQPKVLHTLTGRPMLGYVLDAAMALKPKSICLVLGHKSELVEDYIKSAKIYARAKRRKTRLLIVLQKKLLGSGHALRQAQSCLKGFKGSVLVLYGDNPLITKETLQRLVREHQKQKAGATLLTTILDDPRDYGRIVRDRLNRICKIVEEEEANDFESGIKEVNSGVVCFQKEPLYNCLKSVKLNQKKREYFLTDVIGLLYKKGAFICSQTLRDSEEVKGINTQRDLIEAQKIMQGHLQRKLMAAGVEILAPESTYVSWETQIGYGSRILPFTVIEKNVRIGKFCQIGPFCHLREAVTIKDNTNVGNFVEINRTKIGKRVRVKHFCYLGDARIGENVNIGAGTVTANFNGKEKNITFIGKDAFIGSDTVLVAPVKVGKAAKTGAGCVVTKNRNVPAGRIVAGVPARILKKTNG